MAHFFQSEIDRNIYIWQMFRDGGVALVHSESMLQKIINELHSENYLIHDCEVTSEDSVSFEKSIRATLGFPSGQKDQTNLDALNDLVGDLVFPKDRAGIVVVTRHIQKLHEKEPGYLHQVADIFANAARYHMCLGQRLLLLLQSDDSEIQFDVVGGFRPHWTIREGPFSKK
ncbi:hypothetical protein Pan241w_27780 [Gimesia alba]|uniref:Barstar (barnase inhibitor) domain-containing protein n=2 Tax=Gimesia alba TaxID=2527973 RepID=A0A517RFQ4_9PLAN|nr:hypothetical protein Pan241w_27780 [Gimesia alba]